MAVPTYLKVPFAEKDQAKALGARWDPARKCWYVPDGKDLAAFARWETAGAGGAPAAPGRAGGAGRANSAGPVRTGPAQPPAHCGCNVLPWEPCAHTPA